MELELTTQGIPILLIVGAVIWTGFYSGKLIKKIKLPSIIGYMILGVILGPSLFGILSETVQQDLSFITDIALGFVAVSIGLELKFSTLKEQGKAIIFIILSESFMAFLVVTGAVYLLTRNLPLALIFGSIAPASAPAGTVAIIQEYRARGPLTSALYSVVGFDDGLGIIIFGFASAIAKSLVAPAEIGGGFWQLMAPPLLEIGLSFVVGVALGFIFSILASRTKSRRDVFILIFGAVMLSSGLSHLLHLSLILTNMVLGVIIVNTRSPKLVQTLSSELSQIMPLLFILFFVLAGANLHVSALPALGILGVVYILSRSAGLMGGAALGATLGKAGSNLKKYLGMGILSQAGVAIGLSLTVKAEMPEIGSIVITTVTATCIFFEIIGPVLTKIALTRAGEINVKA